MGRYWMCDAAVLKIPQIARSVFFRQVDSRCYVKYQGTLFWIIQSRHESEVWLHIGDNVL